MYRTVWLGVALAIGKALSGVIHLLLGLILLSATGLILIGNYVMGVIFLIVAFMAYDQVLKRLRNL